VTTYDGNELREALKARLAQRYDSAADAVDAYALDTLTRALRVDPAAGEYALVSMPRSTDPAIAALIADRAAALEQQVTQATIAAQVASVLP
jgi:hypothetical protein